MIYSKKIVIKFEQKMLNYGTFAFLPEYNGLVADQIIVQFK